MMKLKGRFLVILVLFVALLLVEDLAIAQPVIDGPFYKLAEEDQKLHQETGSASGNENEAESIVRSVNPLGTLDSVSPDGDSEAKEDIKIMFPAPRQQIYNMYGGLQGTADTLNSDAHVEQQSNALTHVAVQYAATMKLTEPAIGSAMMEAFNNAQNSVAIRYQQEDHFMRQLDYYPAMKRAVFGRYKLCIHQKIKAGETWIKAQSDCMGDKLEANTSSPFKEVASDQNFVKQFEEGAYDGLVESLGVGYESLTDWLFQREIDRGDENSDKLEEAETQWEEVVGDVWYDEWEVEKGTDDTIASIVTKKRYDSPLYSPVEVHEEFAKYRYEKLIELMKKRCEHEPSLRANDLVVSDSEDRVFKIEDEDRKNTSTINHTMSMHRLNLLLWLFSETFEKDNKGKIDCGKLEASGDAEYKGLLEAQGSGGGGGGSDKKENIPKWITAAHIYANYLGGMDRLLMLANMSRFVYMRAGATGDNPTSGEMASHALQLVDAVTGFDSPEVGISAINQAMFQFWAKIGHLKHIEADDGTFAREKER